MNSELHSTFRLYLETLSPIHIGSGKDDLVADYDFVVEGAVAKVIDTRRFLQETEPAKLDRLADDPRASLVLDQEELERFKAYEIHIASPHRPDRIRQQTKDAFLTAYMPGSSLKGALRTARAWSAHHGALALSSTGDRHNPATADDSLEATLFDYDLHETHRDLLRALRVADAYPQGAIPPSALQVDVFSLRGQPPSLQPKGDPQFVEAIPKRVTMETTLTLDRYALRPERRVRGVHHARRRHFLDQLVERCRQFSGELLKLELDFYSDCAVWKLQAFYETLAKKQASLEPDEFLLPIGWGTGWLSKTVGTKLSRRELGMIAETYRLNKWQGPLFPDVFPKTRRLVGDVVPREPLGWVKASLRSLGA